MLLGENVPEAELDRETPVRLRLDVAGDERLRIDHAPIVVMRRDVRIRVLVDESLGIDRLEQAGALEIGREHAGDVGADRTGAAGKDRNRDRHRFDVAVRQIDVELGVRETRRCRHEERNGGNANREVAARDHAHVRSFGSNVMVKVCH